MITIKFVIALLFLCIAMQGVTTETPKMTIVPVENRKAVITFESTAPTIFVLSVKNDEGNIIYSRKLNQHIKKYNEVFDFGNYDGKNYEVTINYGNKSLTRELKFDRQNNMKVGAVEHLYEPYICLQNEKLNISFLNVAQKSVYVNFYHEGKFITGKYLGNAMCIQKTLDISQFENGTYEIVLSEFLDEHKFMVQK